jgi:periplasmic protein CpxP/Spy
VRKLNRIQLTAMAFVIVGALAVPIVMAQSRQATGEARGRGHHQGRFDQGMMEGMGRVFGQLDLTDAQKSQVKQIREAHREGLGSLMKQIRAKRQEIRQARTGDAFDEALVTQKLAEIAPLEAKLMGEQFRIHQETLSVLTPEQKTKLEQLRDQMKSRWSERRGHKEHKQST